MKLAVVLVHYQTPHLLGPAIEALQVSARRAGLDLDGVVIDNGSQEADRPLLDGASVARGWRVIEPGRNLGYAGGVNRGVEATGATGASLVVAMNPDVEVAPGCLGALVETLEAGADVAGPRFFWDRGGRFQLPPTEKVSRFDELLRTLADRGEPWRTWARRRWRRHARQHWLAHEPLASFDLSGALLAFRRETWNRVGPFDEGYPLYFEETDWLQRARRAGCRSLYVPTAKAVHLYAQSTVGEGRSAEWFETSSQRFRERFYGRIFERLLATVAPEQPAPTRPTLVTASEKSLDEPRWLEVSPSHRGFPAAGGQLAQGQQAELPTEILDRLAPGRYVLRQVSSGGEELVIHEIASPEDEEASIPGADA